MGFMQAMRGANNAWGTVVCSEGIGTVGPENMINNKAQRLMVTIGMNTFVFDKYDISAVKTIQATSEWVKYLIVLKNGKKYVATIMALTAANNSGKSLSASSVGKKINVAINNFEWWLFDFLYSDVSVYSDGVVNYSAISKVSGGVATSKSNPKPSAALSNNTTSAPQKVVSAPKYWYCKKCGAKNHDSKMTCCGCGAYK